MSHPDLVTFSSEIAELMAHVLSCPLCRLKAMRILLKTLSGGAAVPLDPDYSGIWIRLATTRTAAALDLTREKAQAPALLDELLALDPSERLKVVSSDPRYSSYPLAQRLIETALTSSWEEQSEGLSRLALEVVQRLAGFAPRPEAIRDLEVMSRVGLAEVLRRRGDLAGAEAELLVALGKLETPRGETDMRAFYCQVLGRLRRDQDRVDEALALLGHAAELWSRSGNAPAEMALWTELGEVALVEAGDPERALAAFDMAAILPGCSSTEKLQVLCGTARALASLGRGEEGLELLRESCQRGHFGLGSIESLTLLALEGRLEVELGRVPEARRALTKAFAGLKRCGAIYEAVEAGVAVARLLSPGSGRLQSLLDELRDLAQRGGLPQGSREALGCLAAGTLPFRDLDRLSKYLERARLRPHLKWVAEETDGPSEAVH